MVVSSEGLATCQYACHPVAWTQQDTEYRIDGKVPRGNGVLCGREGRHTNDGDLPPPIKQPVPAHHGTGVPDEIITQPKLLDYSVRNVLILEGDSEDVVDVLLAV